MDTAARPAAVALSAILMLALIPACTGTDAKGAAKPKTTESSTTTVAGASATTPKGVDVMPVPVVGPAAAPVSMDQTAEFGNGVTAKVTGTRSLEVTAELPGESSGPATAVTLEIANSSDAAVDLSEVTVDLTDINGKSFDQIDSADAYSAFEGPLVPGQSKSATYVFRLDPDDRANTYLTVKYATDIPTVIFAGSVKDD